MALGMVHWKIVLGLPTRLLTALVSILLMLLALRNLGILRLQSATIPLPPKSTHSVRRLVLKESLCRPIGDEADLKKLARYSLYKLLLIKQARRIQVVYSIGRPPPATKP